MAQVNSGVCWEARGACSRPQAPMVGLGENSMLRPFIFFTALLISLPSQSAEPDFRPELIKALTCQIDPLQSVRELAKVGSSKYASGFVGYSFGEEMDYTAVIILRSPVVIAGAQANGVVAATANYYADFNGVVHARFTGDYKKVVKALGLAPRESGKSFFKQTKVGRDGKPDNGCPMTIELKVLDDGKFVLGCGWCNG